VTEGCFEPPGIEFSVSVECDLRSLEEIGLELRSQGDDVLEVGPGSKLNHGLSEVALALIPDHEDEGDEVESETPFCRDSPEICEAGAPLFSPAVELQGGGEQKKEEEGEHRQHEALFFVTHKRVKEGK